jgi:hypothetical protein
MKRSEKTAAAPRNGRFRAIRASLALVPMALCLVTAGNASGDTNFWVGGASDMNWSTAGNWTQGLPTAETDTFFYLDGAVNDASIVNNTVSSDITVKTLTYKHESLGNTILHHTRVADGVTLTISDPLANTNMVFVGAGTSVAGGTATTTTISGAGGIVSVNSPAGCIIVRNGGLNSYGATAKLDMSDLGTLRTSVRQMLLAGDGTNADLGGGNRYKDRASCYVILANTNILNLLATNVPGLIFASGIGNNSAGSTLKLGHTNAVFCDGGILMGGPKSGTSSVDFLFPGSYLYLRNAAGSGPQNYWGIGDPWSGGGQGGMSMTADLTAGTVDAWINQLIVGRSYRDANKIAPSSGILKFADGKIVANSMIVGYHNVDYAAGISGIVELSGTAELVVSNTLTLGRFRNATMTNGFSLAKLDIRDGASVKVYGGLTSSFTDPDNFDSQLTVNSASLHVRGGLGPFSSLELNNSTLSLDINTLLTSSKPLCYVTNLTTISPIALQIAGSIPATGQFPLIQYATLAGNAGMDITSVTLPPYLKGYISNNVENSSIDLVVTQVDDSNINVSSTALVGASFQLTGTAAWTNASYRVLATTNVLDATSWTLAGSGAFTGGVFSFSESITNRPQRFYRIVAP